MELSARQQSRAEWSSLEEDPTAGHGPSCATYQNRGLPPRCEGALQSLPHLDQAAQTQLDDDSILILRQMYITSLARASRAAVSLPGPRSFLEHPEDPVVSSSLPKAKECSSFWITEEGQLWMEENSLTAISFDQCRLGQLVKKATTIATDLPIQDWDQMRCTHQSHVGTNESSTLSPSPRGKRGPNQGGGPSSSHQGSKPGGMNAPKPRLHGQIHPEADTVSPRGTMNPDFPSPMPSMAGDAEQLGKEAQRDQVLDRPECLPAFRVPRLTDRVAIVQLGFRSRPLRDGGGKWLNPPFRRISPLATLGALIMTLAQPWIDKVRMSLASGATTHPLEADLEELRAILGPRHLHERCPGQPFLLDLVSHLVTLIGSSLWHCQRGSP